MLRKFLFVGLGGSGGKTLRYLRQELEQWLDGIGWTSDFPSAWQMIHIDTPTSQDGEEVQDVAMLPASNYLGLVMAGIDFRAVSDKVASASPVDGWRDLAGWRVDPTYLQVPITTGAGQFRAVGRTIGLAYADRILETLRGASNRLSSATAGAELAEIHRLAYGEQANTPPEPVVVVVSSLTGGTGAGLLLDVCDLLRQLPGSSGKNSFGILYASDVFSDLGEMATAGVQPNALAALSELMNGYWLTGNYARASSLFAAAGAARPIDRSGPTFPFLVGASNTKGVSFGDQKEVYAMMGRALRGWAIDPVIQINLVQYTMANWQNNAAGNVVKADTVMRDHQPVFEAFGYAEVGLGTDHLARYAEQRLARSAADWLLDGHLRRALDNDPDDRREPAEIAEDLARDELVHFLTQVRLHERSDNNQVIDDLEPIETKELLALGCQNVADQVMGEKALSAASWIARISDVVPGNTESFMRAFDERSRIRAQEWVDQVPAGIVEELQQVISRHGLPTAAALMRYVVEEVAVVCEELKSEATDFLRWSADYRSAISAQLTQSGNLPSNNMAVNAAIANGLHTHAGFQGEAKRRELAALLLEQLRTDFLQPLARSIEHARSNLHQIGIVGDGIHEPVVRSWPTGPVPTRMRPPRNEFLVIDLKEVPERFDALLARSSRSEFSAEHLPAARSAIIAGQFLESDEQASGPARPGLEIRSRWCPDPSILPGGVQPRTVATFAAHFLPDDLLARARAWIRQPGSVFCRFLEQDLPSYLGDDTAVDPAETGRRRTAFRQALTSALEAAEPLVRLDAGLLALLHHQARIPQHAVPSTLPFKDHPMEKDIKEILAGALGGGAVAGLEGYFSTATNIRTISISSTLGAAHDPLVFSSIMDPIVSGWNTAKQSPPARTNFWTSRRARPLEEFVPASHEVILAMTRGWFTGLLLGRIDRENGRIARRGGVAVFPDPLLREPGSVRDRLPAVLESLGLAYAEVAKLHSLDPLGGYIELRDLGIQPGLVSMQAAHLYEHLNADLEHWVRTGDTGQRLTTPVVENVVGRELASATPAERRVAGVELLEKTAREYKVEIDDYRKHWTDDRSVLGPDRAMWPGMSSVIDRALAELGTALQKLELVDTNTVM